MTSLWYISQCGTIYLASSATYDHGKCVARREEELARITLLRILTGINADSAEKRKRKMKVGEERQLSMRVGVCIEIPYVWPQLLSKLVKPRSEGSRGEHRTVITCRSVPQVSTTYGVGYSREYACSLCGNLLPTH